MARFTTRVELRDATWSDYELLHRVMAQAGFVRTITSDSGVTFDLPDAEYNFEGAATIDQVLQAARSAANSTGRQNGVLVTEAVQRKWVLEPV